jgi:hypothetical protein
MNTQKPDNEVPVGYYIVAYLDVLGQKNHLKKIDELPKSPKEREELIQNLKKTYGKIDLFRKVFETFFQSFIKARQASKLSPDIHRIFSIPQVKKHFFSDTVVLYSSLAEHENNFALGNIYAMIESISKLYLFMLSEKFVFRGGVDVGIGCEFLDGEIYGNALYKAYELESKAKYPRIIVGDNLIKCVRSYREKSTDPIQTFTNDMAEACLNYIQKDCNDGNYILLPTYRNGMKNEIDSWKKFAITFTKDEISRFAKENNIELKNRYELLEKILMTMYFRN